ncbi:DMT family transporter [Desulfoscipio geothermicus]|uniref:Permease of the drug/metabolite transporter (DMT) superfamily n=1 Tax=Desulfoscipio geothermicus DSM 3669 TaxID=1121426 RepID=A0A1I6EJK4_9FIRM|nr:DMT family transporter [Desulfoscipio geothermicus]SFR17875.1 Permease of the drug/metabolite transporter (DMT) superfamily [Desulfoscipio geothermicus DSM 3669]
MDALKKRQVKADLALLFVAFSWGLTFVVVQDALSGIGPYYFVALRFLLAAAFLAVVYWRHLADLNRATLQAGAFIGLFLFGGYAFQTVGLQYTGPATAGFITGLAVVLVPLFTALLYRRMPGPYVVVGVACATLGLGFLTLQGGGFKLGLGDILIFCCAICFGLHILMVGRYAGRHNPVLMAIIQITTVSVVSFIFALGLEKMPAQITTPIWVAFFITAIPATALAFLIQNTVQRYTSPTHTAIIFTMEPVFSAITAHLLGREILAGVQVAGCTLILAGMLVAELKGGADTAESLNQEKDRLVEKPGLS